MLGWVHTRSRALSHRHLFLKGSKGQAACKSLTELQLPRHAVHLSWCSLHTHKAVYLPQESEIIGSPQSGHLLLLAVPPSCPHSAPGPTHTSGVLSCSPVSSGQITQHMLFCGRFSSLRIMLSSLCPACAHCT